MIELKDYSKAIKMLDECRPLQSKGADELAACNYLYAKVLQLRGNDTEAAERYGRAYVYAKNKNIREEALFKQSKINYEKKRYFLSRAEFKAFLRNFPKSKYAAEAGAYLAKSLEETGAIEEALTYYDKAEDSPEVLYGKANILHQMGKYKEAEKAYSKAISKGMGYLLKDEKTRYYYGENLFTNGNTKKAKSFLSLVKDEKFKDRAKLYIGIISMEDAKPDKAIEFLTEAASAKDSLAKKKAFLNLAALFIKHDMPDKAKEALENLKALFMTEEEKVKFRKTLLSLADAYMKNSMPDKAKEVLLNLKHMLTNDEEKALFRKYFLKLADTYLDKGIVDETTKLIASLKEMNLTEDDKAMLRKIYFKLVNTQVKSGVLNEAKETLDVIKSMNLTTDEKNELSLMNVNMKLKGKKFKDAIDAIVEQLKSSPDSKELSDMLQNVLSEAMKGDKKEFLSLWDSYGSYLLNPSREKFIMDVKNALKGQGKSYENILLWQSKNGPEKEKYNALRELSDMSSKAGDKSAAVKYLGQLKGLNATPDEINRLEADMFYSNGDFRNAILKMMDLKELKKDDKKIIVDTIGQIDDKARGAAFFEKTINTLGASQSDYLLLADMYASAGKKEQAIKYYKQILQTDPGNDRALYGIATGSTGAEAGDALQKLSLINSTLGNYAKSMLQQKELDKKLEGANP
ncbi:MAG: tetratricopeptide repeat protein [Nitrospirae bacterium]|nr:tetratricopeptide repeat protein [Nitrospirota bacterium]MBF0535018.1 tetratricopeptide repeat protein [Nitrospirota bacterium]MBF0616526.1 tetratricopeptide repeat protein [Nitrospirota bacterium]